MKWVQLAWRNVGRNFGRSLIVMLIVFVGAVSTMISIGFILASFEGLRESTILGGVGHIQVSKEDNFLSQNDVDALYEWANDSNHTRFLMGRVNFDALISTGALTHTVQVVGIEPELERRMIIGFAPVTSGKSLPLDYDAQDPQITVGRELGDLLASDPGTSLTLLGTTVDGVLNAIDLNLRGTYSTGVPDLDKRQGLTHIQTAKFLLNTEQTQTIVVVLRNTALTELIAQELRSRFPELDVKTWNEIAPFYERVVTMYKSIFVVLGLVLSIVIAFSVVNVVVLAINERRKEMGTMIALGIQRSKIRFTFAMEGFIMGALAATAGVVVGGIGAFVITQFGIELPPPPGRSLGYPLIIHSNVIAGAAIAAFFALLTGVVAWIPTFKLNKREVIEFLSER